MSDGIFLKVIPGAKIDQIAGQMADGTIKVRLKAKAVDGRANESLMQFISEKLKIPQDDLQIIAGKFSRRKLIKISNMTGQEVINKLLQVQDEP
jgi:uncharacterized protein (TIGR00251 family)